MTITMGGRAALTIFTASRGWILRFPMSIQNIQVDVGSCYCSCSHSTFLLNASTIALS